MHSTPSNVYSRSFFARSSPASLVNSVTDIFWLQQTAVFHLLQAIRTVPVSLRHFFQPHALLLIMCFHRPHQVEHPLAALRSILVAAHDVVVDAQPALLAHAAHLLATVGTEPLALRHLLRLHLSPRPYSQMRAAQVEGRRAPVAADQLAALAAHLAVLVPLVS